MIFGNPRLEFGFYDCQVKGMVYSFNMLLCNLCDHWSYIDQELFKPFSYSSII